MGSEEDEKSMREGGMGLERCFHGLVGGGRRKSDTQGDPQNRHVVSFGRN